MTEDSSIDYDLLREAVVKSVRPVGKMTARGLSLAASNQRNPDLVRNFLKNGTKPAIASVAGLCDAMGVEFVLMLKDYTGPIPAPSSWLVVNSDVEAGSWREQTEWGPADWYEIQIEPSDFGRRHTFGAVVKGRSMEKVLPPGTILRCEDIAFGLTSFNDGDYAIVQRTRHGLTELTCKRLALQPDGTWMLHAESYQPEFQDPIALGSPPDPEFETWFTLPDDDVVSIRAIVIDAYLPLKRRRTRPVQ
ncbi:S24 family peptidase [Sphingomonas sp. Leaf226]|uniref:S24 family peptidase n=1 Tax=Sphingomonas sp. Leaf226 TaxID=1735691 RepID=UPI000700E54B|nr:S24 family peptidase [Sphingomonas sp. Leaf226]KQM99451.1 hypothetical protein ASE77_00175 [Sphingomonas sp. Leaf226]